MWERLRRFSALERPAQSLLLRAIVLLPLISLSLRMRGFRATQTTLRRLNSNRPNQLSAEARSTRVAQTARMVHAAVRHCPGPPSCLEESLTLWWLLGRQGISAEVRIGIRKNKEEFEAHAWVEREGVALNEPEAHHHYYAAFGASFSSQPPEEQ
jgi:hypothetical protein